MKNSKPKVSVVTITYAHEKYIEDTLRGVLMQQYDGPIEFIIANDNSPDQTDEVVKKFFDTHPIPENIEIKYTCHQENKGMMPNFIWALEQATGEYIALCEGDDYWTDPLKLQKQVDFLEDNEEYSMCFTNRSFLDENNILKTSSPLERDYSVEDILKGFVAHTLTIMFRNVDVIVKKVTEFNFNVGDRPLTYFCSLAGKVKLLKDDTAVYRYNGLGAWSSKKDDNLVYQNLKNLKQFHTLVGINNYQYLLVSASNNFLSNILKKKNFSNFIRLNQQLKELEIPVNKVYIHIANYYLSILKRKLKI